MNKSKKFHITVFGCQMNKSDAQRVSAVLQNCGLVSTAKQSQADVAVIVACSVRQTAIDRVWGIVNNLDKKVIKILTGCILSTDQKAFQKKFDLVFDIKKMHELENFLTHKNILKYDYFGIIPKYESKFQAFVPIMTGCNNFCSYCAVPYVRGREQSRSVKEILAEVNRLALDGYKQITLLGQNVNSFNPDDKKNFSIDNIYTHSFAKLLWQINKIKGLKRIFFTAAHPKDMSDEVIDALKLPKMADYIHLALQSGDDQVLSRMNRQYTVADYEKIIKKIRQIKPRIAIGTDIIVGFPGETEKQFENTLNFYKKIKFDIAYLAQYSPRTMTKAYDLADTVSLEKKKQRWRRLQDLMEKITYQKNQKYLGKICEVLVEQSKDGYCLGDDQHYKKVRFAGTPKLVGKIVKVKIVKAYEWLLFGERVKK